MSTERQETNFGTSRFLATHAVFRLQDLRAAMGEPSPSAVRTWLRFHGSRGRLQVVERGLYAAVPADADAERFRPDAVLVGRAARPDGVFAGHAALELLGAAHSVGRVLTVFTAKRRRSLVVGEARVEFCAHPTPLARLSKVSLGVREVRYRGAAVRVTGPERTLLDGFRNLRLVSGLEELVESAAGFPSLDLDLLKHVLTAYDERMLWAAAGWFLDRNRRAFGVPQEYLRLLERHRPASPHYLPRRQRGKGGTLASRWNLILPGSVARGGESGGA